VSNLNNHEFVKVIFSNHELLLSSSGCCYWPQKKTLIVADLHFEKGSYFARRGNPLPTTDTRDTLQRLQAQIIAFQPETIICLGDNIHDGKAFMRMDIADLVMLQSLCESVANWHWIVGNHDSIQLQNHPLRTMQFHAELLIADVWFTHASCEEHAINIIGHYHPKISLHKRGVKIKGKCFVVTEETIIMPSFGSYTGGLDIHHQAYLGVLKSLPQYYLMFKNTIYLAK
jgi:DNA ligase-associated metallophosphoesterase